MQVVSQQMQRSLNFSHQGNASKTMMKSHTHTHIQEEQKLRRWTTPSFGEEDTEPLESSCTPVRE